MAVFLIGLRRIQSNAYCGGDGTGRDNDELWRVHILWRIGMKVREILETVVCSYRIDSWNSKTFLNTGLIRFNRNGAEIDLHYIIRGRKRVKASNDYKVIDLMSHLLKLFLKIISSNICTKHQEGTGDTHLGIKLQWREAGVCATGHTHEASHDALAKFQWWLLAPEVVGSPLLE